MIGLSAPIVSLGAGCLAGMVSKPVAACFAGQVTPRAWILILMQAGVATSAGLLAPAGSLPISLGLGAVLCLLGVIDALVLRLPDILTLPLLLLGLVMTAISTPSALRDHLVGATLGYGVLALAAAIYARARHHEGLGLGDAKLLACAGAWLGWRPLPLVLLAAALGGIAWTLTARLRRGPAAWREAIPFGVPLALAFWIAWLVAARGAAL